MTTPKHYAIFATTQREVASDQSNAPNRHFRIEHPLRAGPFGSASPRDFRIRGYRATAILKKPVSDRGTLEDLSQS